MWKALIAATVIGSAITAMPVQQARAGTGSELLEDCSLAVRGRGQLTTSTDFQGSAYCSGFVRGFVSANVAYSVLKRTDHPFFCGPEDAIVSQYVRVVHKYLQDHPERLHETDGPLVLQALTEAFPCNKS